MRDRSAPGQAVRGGAFERRLHHICGAYAAGFVAFVLMLGVLEHMGLPKSWIGAIFLGSTVIVVVSLLTPAPSAQQRARAEQVRYPRLDPPTDRPSGAAGFGL